MKSHAIDQKQRLAGTACLDPDHIGLSVGFMVTAAP